MATGRQGPGLTPAHPSQQENQTITAADCYRLQHDPEKAWPGLDPGWAPVFGQIMLQQ
jgi:hypothetical protein